VSRDPCRHPPHHRPRAQSGRTPPARTTDQRHAEHGRLGNPIEHRAQDDPHSGVPAIIIGFARSLHALPVAASDPGNQAIPYEEDDRAQNERERNLNRRGVLHRRNDQLEGDRRDQSTHAERHDQSDHEPAQLECEGDLGGDDERRCADESPEGRFTHSAVLSRYRNRRLAGAAGTFRTNLECPRFISLT
jgi:hypothetical protein